MSDSKRLVSDDNDEDKAAIDMDEEYSGGDSKPVKKLRQSSGTAR